MNINDAPVDLCDTSEVWGNVIGIRTDMQHNETLKTKNNAQDEMIDLDTKYKEFNERYPSLFKIVKSGAPLDLLKKMTDTIENIKKGNDTYRGGMDKVAKSIGDKFLPKNAVKNSVKDDTE